MCGGEHSDNWRASKKKGFPSCTYAEIRVPSNDPVSDNFTGVDRSRDEYDALSHRDDNFTSVD